MINNETQKSRGFGFITYACSTMVDACQKARPHTLDNKVVECKRAVPRDDTNPVNHQTVKKLFVSGIKKELTEDDLRNYFKDFGTLEEVDVIKDRDTQENRGFAFVTFDDYDPVDKLVILKSHQITTPEFGTFKCDVKKAAPKDS